MTEPNADAVAQWLADEVTRRGELNQQDAAGDIEREFGDQFTYTNDNGNQAIDKTVLKKFNELTKETVVWSRLYRYWRMRNQQDRPGRMQDD